MTGASLPSLARLCLLVAALALVAGCAASVGGERGAPRTAATEERDRAPEHVPPDLALIPDPTPKEEAPSRYGNHSPYTVLGQTYEVMDSADGYRESGVASWYGAKFHGRRTSSGEAYDMYRLTAAHRHLPLPTYVRVTNLENDRSVIVRVNDRGPFHDDRLIDLSYAAAVRLGFAEAGTTHVAVETATPDTDGELLFLQAGAFSQRERAERAKRALSSLLASAVELRHSSRDELFRVWIGPIAHSAEVARIREQLRGTDFAAPLLVRE